MSDRLPSGCISSRWGLICLWVACFPSGMMMLLGIGDAGAHARLVGHSFRPWATRDWPGSFLPVIDMPECFSSQVRRPDIRCLCLLRWLTDTCLTRPFLEYPIVPSSLQWISPNTYHFHHCGLTRFQAGKNDFANEQGECLPDAMGINAVDRESCLVRGSGVVCCTTPVPFSWEPEPPSTAYPLLPSSLLPLKQPKNLA